VVAAVAPGPEVVEQEVLDNQEKLYELDLHTKRRAEKR